jgi:hypothetical protein
MILALQLSAIAGQTMTPLKRGYPMEAAGDIVATDPLGRLHLFELKKGPFSPRHVDQIEHYLLGHVFHGPEVFRDQCLEEAARQFTPESIARDLLGAAAGVRIGTCVPRFVTEHVVDWHELVGEPAAKLSKSRYHLESQRVV